MEPGYTQILSSMIGLPWALKIFYGIISDNYPLYGSRRINYLLLMSFAQLLASLFLASISDSGNEELITFLLTVISFSVAVMDVIVDSLMVI